MPNIISQLATQLPQPALPQAVQAAGETLRGLIEGNAYVGEVVSLGYNDAILQIHDFDRQKVGGIPALCFLLASRVNPEITPDARVEDSSVVLLRVMDHADLPNAEEAKRVRVENAQRVSGDGPNKKRFTNGKNYSTLLERAFAAAAARLRGDAVIIVRTDARKFTLSTTVNALHKVFPRKRMVLSQSRLKRRLSQTALFGDKSSKPGEIDIILAPVKNPAP